VRKLPELADSILKTTLSFLLDVEEDPAWDVAEEESDFDAGQGDLYSCGMESLDRLSCALGGKILMPLAGRLLPSYLAQPDWKCRHAGLQALSQIAEGCTLVMARDAATIATMIAALFRDPHPRVRWYAHVHASGPACLPLDILTPPLSRPLPAGLPSTRSASSAPTWRPTCSAARTPSSAPPSSPC
jgi:hypothetical protein